jgi:uncharacterized membrane protein YfcA
VRILLTLPFGVLIGMALGALGGGGSILALPVLVYAVGLGPRMAVTTSLVVVGVAAVGGLIGHWRAGHVRFGVGLWFGTAGVAGSVIGSRLGGRVDPKVLLATFAGLMLVVAWRMWAPTRLRSREPDRAANRPTRSLTSVASAAQGTPLPPASVPPDRMTAPAAGRFERPLALVVAVAVAGTSVGFLTGFFGIGGGFIIVPSLVLILGFDMPAAAGTSLVVIAVNSGIALVNRVATTGVDWRVALPFTLAALIGAVAGQHLARRLPSRTLTRWFAALLVGVAAYTLARTLSG